MEKPEFKIIEGGAQDSEPQEDQDRSAAKKGHPSNSGSPDWTGTPEPSESSGEADETDDEENAGDQPKAPTDLRSRIIKRDLGGHFWGDDVS